jgi:hypothetical protein
VRIFKTRWFARFARQQEIDDQSLCDAVARAERGLIDADLGGGVIKQRIARPNEGKSGGFRSIVLFRSGENAFFVFGFPKSAKDNIRTDELKGFKALAEEMLNYDAGALKRATANNAVTEVVCDDEDIPE